MICPMWACGGISNCGQSASKYYGWGGHRPGYNSELDELREIGKSGKTWIAGMKKGKRSHGHLEPKNRISKVFGYFIEVTRSYQNRVPSHLCPQANTGGVRALHYRGA